MCSRPSALSCSIEPQAWSNFAQGAVGALAAFISWSIVERGGPESLSWLVGVAVATIVSLAYGRLIATRLVSTDPITRAVATLSFALILLGFMGYLWGEAPRRLRLPTDTMSFELLGVRVTLTRAIAFGLGVSVTALVMLFLSRSRMGLQMRALASNRELSAMLGVRVFRIRRLGLGHFRRAGGRERRAARRSAAVERANAHIRRHPRDCSRGHRALCFASRHGGRRACDRRLRGASDARAPDRSVPFGYSIHLRGRRDVVDAAQARLRLQVSAK